MEKRKGEHQTFIVKITNRENGTLQGKMVWANREETRRFRSMLEMIRLIDDATKTMASKQEKEA